MKKLLLSSSVLLLVTVAFAQKKMKDEDTRFGIKTGINFSTFSGKGIYEKSDYKNNMGFNVTVFGDFGIGNNFFIQPAVSLQNKGSKSGDAVFTAKQSVMAIEVPINAIFRIPTGDAGAIQINVGPYIGFNISGKNKYTGNIPSTSSSTPTYNGTLEQNMKFGNEMNKDLSRIDYGANFGLGFRISSGFLIGANYGLGLANLVPKDKRIGDDKIF